MDKQNYCLAPREIEARLTAVGIRPTAQRIAICRHVLCDADHPTADEVKAEVDRTFPKVSMATVYNTLHALVQAGLLRECRLPQRDKVVFDNNMAAHHHFVDRKTGRILDFDAALTRIDLPFADLAEVAEVQLVVSGDLGPEA